MHKSDNHNTRAMKRSPTREISLLIGCKVGSSAINPAATMGIMAVNILMKTDNRQQKHYGMSVKYNKKKAYYMI